MRTGAIFARGSCRALKWMALFGVVFALGVGSAAAQVDVDIKVAKEVAEGGTATITFTVKRTVKPGDSEATLTAIVVAHSDDVADHAAFEPADVRLNPDHVEITFPPGNPVGEGAKDLLVTEIGTVDLQTSQDPDAEDEVVGLKYEYQALGGFFGADQTLPKPGEITIKDDETQNYELTLHEDVTDKDLVESGTVRVTLQAVPAHDGMSSVLALHLDQKPPFKIDISPAGNTRDANTVRIGVGGDGVDSAVDSATVTITTNGEDGNRVDDTITLSVYSGSAGKAHLEDALEITLADKDALPAVTVTAIVLDEDGDPVDPQPDMVESIMEGQKIGLEVTVVNKEGKAIKAGEDLMVSLMPTGDANEQDYRLAPHPVEIKEGMESNKKIQLTVSEDQDIGMEMLMFDATVSGDATIGPETRTSMGVLSLAIMDTTMKQVEAMPDTTIQQVVYAAKEAGAGDDMKFSPGEMIEVDASMLFTAAEGYSLSFGAMSDNMMAASASASGNMVMVMAEAPGEMVHITVTATATMMMSGAKGLPQTTPNVAQVIFPVDVELMDLMVTLSGPEDMNVAEGMEAMITAMANRPVTEDTMVELIQTDGTASPADYMAKPLMIMAGEMEGTTMLMAVEDEMMEDMEMLTLEGRVGTMKTNTVMFTIWDMAVPALPIIAQLLLGLFLALGGYRRYLRR